MAKITKTIFVYGSLLTGFYNYDKYLKGKVISVEKGYIKGTLYHLNNKGYPGYIEEGNTIVYGEVITFDDTDNSLSKMDILEGYRGVFNNENEYNRIPQLVILVDSGKAMWLDVYVYNPVAEDNLCDERIIIDDGCWRRYMQNFK